MKATREEMFERYEEKINEKLRTEYDMKLSNFEEWKLWVSKLLDELIADKNITITEYSSEDMSIYYTDKEAPAFQRIWLDFSKEEVYIRLMSETDDHLYVVLESARFPIGPIKGFGIKNTIGYLKFYAVTNSKTEIAKRKKSAKEQVIQMLENMSDAEVYSILKSLNKEYENINREQEKEN